jgi:hypothetical protein
MIDVFTRQRFEAALPVHNLTGAALWRGLGLYWGEYCYAIDVRPGVLIFIQSSMDSSGYAALSGKDSIRVRLASDETGSPLGSKMSRWITRIPGWEDRLKTQLRAFWTIGMKLKPCPTCGATLKAFLVQKEGPNEGRWFIKCCETFQWITEPKQEKENGKETKATTADSH